MVGVPDVESEKIATIRNRKRATGGCDGLIDEVDRDAGSVKQRDDLPTKTLLKSEQTRFRRRSDPASCEDDFEIIADTDFRAQVIRGILTVFIFLLLWHGFLWVLDSTGLEKSVVRWESGLRASLNSHITSDTAEATQQ